MNSIDLETKIEGLKKAIAEHEDFTGTYKSQLETAKQELADINKPELTSSQFDDIYEAVEGGVDTFDWSDTDNFEIEYGINYDGRLNCDSHDFKNSHDLVQMIVDEVSKLFVETEAEELDTTENDNHKPVE